jgi:hypothetical protein
MKKTTTIVACFTLLLATLFYACDKTAINEIVTEETSLVALKSSYNLLDYRPNVYHDFFKLTNHSIGYSSLKPNSFTQHSIVQRLNLDNEKIQQHVEINGKPLLDFTSSSKLIGAQEEHIYGKTINFKVNIPNPTAKGVAAKTEVSLYVPDLIEITNPKVSNAEEQFPFCYFKDFVLEWNADTNNKEGLVVIAEYVGDNAIPKNSTNKHVVNTDFIEADNGRIVLDKDLFKGIPNLSMVDIILLRGNVSIEEIDKKTYKFYAETHVRLPIVLVKDLTTIAKE